MKTIRGSLGLIQKAWKSVCEALMLVQVLPPSFEMRPGLPPTKIFWSLVGSTQIWLKYMGRSSWLLMKVQVLPPSSERNTPLAFGLGGPGGIPLLPRPPPPPPPPPPPRRPPPPPPQPRPQLRQRLPHQPRQLQWAPIRLRHRRRN